MTQFATSDEKLQKIHAASMEILATSGMRFLNDEVLAKIREKGVRVEGDVAFFTEEEILTWVSKAPETFTIYGRNKEYDMNVGGEAVNFCPASGASNIGDLAGNKRRGCVKDYQNFLKLYHQNEDYKINGGLLIQPIDVEKSLPALMQYLTISYTDKCLVAITGDYQEEVDMLEVTAAAFGGKEAIMAKPRVITIVNTNTPLQFDMKMSETLLAFAAYRQPVVIAAAAMAGTTSPVTLAGTIALANAEIIATIAAAQMVCPGLPVVYGSQTCASDLRSGSIAIGSPEGALCYEYGAKLAKAYGLPCRGGGSVTDAKVLNAQAGAESLMTLWSTAKAGTNLIFQSSGIMDGYNFISYEKLIMDFEMIKMVKRLLAGVDTAENALAVEAINEVGIAGEYISAEHTFMNMKKETFVPTLAMRGPCVGDAKALYEEGITAKLNQMLANYERPALSADAVAAMEEVLLNLGFSEAEFKEILA